MKRSLFSLTFASYLFLTLSLLLLLFLFSGRVLGDYARSSQDEHLQHMALALRSGAADRLDDEAGLNRLVRELDQQTGARITVVRGDGRVAADSELDARQMENHGDRPEIIAARRGETGRSTRFSSTLGQSMRYCALPLWRQGRIVGVLRVALPERTIAHIADRLQARIAMALGFLLLLALLLAYFFSRSLAGPIRQLADASQRLADGDTSARVHLRGSAEITRLVANFNRMVEQLAGTIGELSGSREQLRTVLASIREGLLVLDPQGRVVLCNDSLRRMGDGSDPTGRFYWEVTREEPFQRLLARALAGRQDIEGDIDLGGRSYNVGFRFLERNGHLVITLHDVSEFRRLERIKKDFLINFSHELRTPLTAIKGYAETLAEEGPAADPAYLAIIRRHTDRLIAIVNDMLLLSELGEKGLPPQWAEVRLADIVANVVRLFARRAREKNIALTVRLAPDLPPFHGEPLRLEQLLINLVDNALKYSDRGEIVIGGECRDGQMVLRVRDSGPGIPAEHVARIFERFYVVDRSRSRQVGGSGLGLAIVKHIVRRHNGRIEVASQPGRGSEFTVTLPLTQPADPGIPPAEQSGQS